MVHLLHRRHTTPAGRCHNGSRPPSSPGIIEATAGAAANTHPAEGGSRDKSGAAVHRVKHKGWEDGGRDGDGTGAGWGRWRKGDKWNGRTGEENGEGRVGNDAGYGLGARCGTDIGRVVWKKGGLGEGSHGSKSIANQAHLGPETETRGAQPPSLSGPQWHPPSPGIAVVSPGHPSRADDRDILVMVDLGRGPGSEPIAVEVDRQAASWRNT